MQKLNRRAAMTALGGIVAAMPGVALAAKPAKSDMEDDLRMLITELRRENPPEDLWKWKDGRQEADWFTYGQHKTNELIAVRLERLLKVGG